MEEKRRNERDKIDRRRFLKVACGSAACLGAAACLPHADGDWDSCTESQPLIEAPSSNRVVEVHSEQAVIQVEGKSAIDAGVVIAMFAAGLQSLTGQAEAAEAWRVVLPGRKDGERIALKANALNQDVPSSPELLAAVIGSLTEGGIPAADVFVWDRTVRELELAGITPERLGVDCRGTIYSSGDDSGPGYEQEAACLSGCKIHLSTILTRETDHLINVAVLKNHFAAGFSGCLKNNYGCFENPYDFHDGCEQHIALLNALPQIASVARLCVLDSLFAVTSGDTNKPADCEPGLILLSFDPVAIDQRGLDVRDRIRASRGQDPGNPAGYLQVAADMGMGNIDYDLQTIEI
ncbi:MAG TPA: DUF362 domain-containing protein [Myxococcota bacterium]|nr:DUF362 domain-containing protein [Myxococcota bacterium]